MDSGRHHKENRRMSTAARRRLMVFDCPGNVGQLKNRIVSMGVVDYDGVLDLDGLPEGLFPREQSAGETDGRGLSSLVGKPLSEIEGIFIAETLQFTGGNREEAAKVLGIGERTLYRKIKEYQL